MHTVPRAASLREELRASSVEARRFLDAFFDEGTFLETETYYKNGEGYFEGVVTGFGAVDGRPVFAFVQDYENGRAAFTAVHAKKIASLYDRAMKAGAPVVGVFAGAGAKLTEGIDCLSAYGLVMRKANEAKGLLPQIAVIAGDCGGAASVFAEMFDFTVVDEAKGERYLCPAVDRKKTARADRFASGVEGLAAETRLLLNHLPSHAGEGTVCGLFNEAVNQVTDVSAAVAEGNTVGLLEELSDDRHVLLLDDGAVPELLCGFLTLGGRVIGAVANRSKENGGRLTAEAADKAARFVRFCGSFAIPLLTLVDTVGMAGEDPRPFAALAAAYADSESARVTVIVGAAYGSAMTVLGSKAVGADLVFALDSAVISVLPPETAVEFLWDKRLRDADDPKEARQALTDEWITTEASPLMAARSGDVDDIVASDELKQRIAAALEMLA